MWLDMIEKRNRKSHIYNEDTAQKIVFEIKNNYFPASIALRERLYALMDD